MVALLRKIYHTVLPFKIRKYIITVRLRFSLHGYYNEKKRLGQLDNVAKKDITLLSERINAGDFETFAYIDESIRDYYRQRVYDVLIAPEYGLPYIECNNIRMYFKRTMDSAMCNNYLNGVSIEQYFTSPHRYMTNNYYFFGVDDNIVPSSQKKLDEDSFGVDVGDVVLDIGAGEGNFFLSVVNVVKKIYLFECDIAWCEALRATTMPYMDKTKLIEKYMSDVDTESSVTLDTFLRNEGINHDQSLFIKIDVEGYEEKVLSTLSSLLNDNITIKLAVCVYHCPQDDILLSNLLIRLGFKVWFTQGYMIYQGDIRRGVLRAVREKSI